MHVLDENAQELTEKLMFHRSQQYFTFLLKVSGVQCTVYMVYCNHNHCAYQRSDSLHEYVFFLLIRRFVAHDRSFLNRHRFLKEDGKNVGGRT